MNQKLYSAFNQNLRVFFLKIFKTKLINLFNYMHIINILNKIATKNVFYFVFC